MSAPFFAESEIVSLVARNHPKEEIVKGLHRSVVNRIMSMVRSVGLTPPFSMTGGVAKNQGVVALFSENLGQAPLVTHEPQLVGALGAALIARREASEQNNKTEQTFPSKTSLNLATR